MALTNIWKNLIENKEESVAKAKEWVNSHSNNNNSNGYVSVADLRREEYGDTGGGGGGGGGGGTSGNDQRQEQLRQRQEEERRQQQEEEERKQREAEQRAAAERQRIEAEQKRAEEQRLAREAAARRMAELKAQKEAAQQAAQQAMNESQNNTAPQTSTPQTSTPQQSQPESNNEPEQGGGSGESSPAAQNNTPAQNQNRQNFNNLVDLSNGEYSFNSLVGMPYGQEGSPYLNIGPRYYEQMYDNGFRPTVQDNGQSGIPTQNYAQYVNNTLQRVANTTGNNQHEKAEPAETAQDLYDQWKNLIQKDTEEEADQPHDYFSANPDVRQYTPGTEEYAGANSTHDYFSANPAVRQYTPGTEEYTAAQPVTIPEKPAGYSDSDINQAIQFMRNELGIMEYDPVAEREYAEQLLNDGAFTPINEAERIAPGIQERNEILSTIADQVGNAVSERLSGIGEGVAEGIADRNQLIRDFADLAASNAPDISGSIAERNQILGDLVAQAGTTLGETGENIANGISERNALLGQMLDNAGGSIANGVSERNALVGPVIQNVRDRVEEGIQRRNDIIRSLLNGEAQPNWNNLKPQPSPDALTQEPEMLFPTNFGGNSANPYDYPGRSNGYVPTDYLRENPGESKGPGLLYDAIAGLYNASNSDGWATQQASDLYGNLPRIDPETPGAEILEQQRRDRMADLIRQIEADDELRDDHPKITGQQIKDAIDRSQNDTREFTEGLIDFARDVTEPISTGVKNWAEQDDSKYGKTVQGAQDAALAAGLFPGTAAYENFVNNYVQERTPREVDPSAYNDRANQGMYNYYRGQGYSEDLARRILQNPNESAAIQDAFNNYRASGIDSGLANRLIMEPDKYFVNPETGKVGVRVDRNDIVDYARRNWDPERFMDDLMLMRAPDINPETGEFNTAAQAIFMGLDPDDPYSQIQKEAGATLTPEQMLHLFDREGAFHNPESGVNSESSFADLLASDSTHAQRNPELAKTLRMTADQYLNKFNDFLNANPIIAMMLQLGLVTAQDIEKNFFNNVELTQGPANGSGNYSGYGSYSKRSSGGGGSYRSYGGGGGGSSSYARRVSANSTPSLSSNGTTQSRSSGYATRSGSVNAYTQPRVNKTPTVKNQQAQRINNIMKNWSF